MKCKSTSSHKIVKQSRYKAKQVISVLWKTPEQALPHRDIFRKVECLPLTQVQNTAFDYCDSAHRTYIANGLFSLVSPFHILLLGSY